MALPTAVKRKSELARQMIAERSGQPPVQSPQASDEYLNVDSATSEPEYLGEQSQTAPAQEAARDDTRRDHVLSDSYVGDAVDDSGLFNGRPSDTDTVNADGSSSDASKFIDENDWKARYTALRTSRDDRIAVLEQENRQYKTNIEGLNKRLQAQSKPEDPAVHRFELDDETRSLLGADQVKALDKHNQSVEQRFAQQEQERQKENDRAAMSFESDLESLIPKWREINVDPNFLTWLNQNDEVMKVRRQDMLDGFVASRDASSVAALFRSFAGRSGHVQQRNGQSQSPDIDGTRASSGMGAEEQLVEMWDQSEVKDFFERKSRLYRAGKLKGDILDQVTAEEARIRRAMSENRVDTTR